MCKLTIVVTHYKEPWETCKFLFDSIEIQHGVDFNDFRVLVVNDGDEKPLDEAHFANYKYEIEQVIRPHLGLSETRNYGIDYGDSDYLMFCDCDDGFLSNYGLHLVLGAIEEGFDFLYSSFIEEQPLPSGGWKIFRRDKDVVFVHGKVYRREFLRENNIRFNPQLYLNEDSLFNKIAYHSADKVKNIETPFYLWSWNGASTVRKDREDFVLKTYDQVMLMRRLACVELKERGFIDEYFETVVRTVMDVYYDFQKPEFVKKDNAKLAKKAEKEFRRFWNEFADSFWECDSDRISRVMQASRLLAYNNGMRMERIDLKSWLNHIRKEVRV